MPLYDPIQCERWEATLLFHCTAGPCQLADAATFGIAEQHFFFDPDDPSGPIDAAQEDRPEGTHG